jgi:acyl carrier protein
MPASNNARADLGSPDGTSSTVGAIRSFVCQRFPALPPDLSPTESLLESGAVDSLGLLDIVMFIEERFDIVIDDDELTGEHFESLEAIASLAESKLG